MTGRYQVRIDVTIVDQQNMSGNLRISEDAQIEGGNFLELAAILGEFHTTLEKIKKAEHDQAS